MKKLGVKYKKNILGVLKITMMTFIMSFISTVRNYWLNDWFFHIWMVNWFYVLIFVIPIVFLFINPFINKLWKIFFNN